MELRIARCCHCVKKNDLAESLSVSSRDEALAKAEELLMLLQEKSCGAHRFFIREEPTAVIIDSKFNDDIVTL